jgi:hypothetical protein
VQGTHELPGSIVLRATSDVRAVTSRISAQHPCVSTRRVSAASTSLPLANWREASVHRQDAQQFPARRADLARAAERTHHQRATEPLDTCLSCYKQLFAHGQHYSYALRDLGLYYLEYERLMAHWRAVLPGRVLDVQYESVVMDTEAATRRVLEHCGLPWEDGCLRFHENPRAVRTASSEQVRQPLYHRMQLA